MGENEQEKNEAENAEQEQDSGNGSGRTGKEKKEKKEKSTGVRFSLRLKFSLAIIGLVTMIILTITAYFTWRETNLLEEQIFRFVEREVVHLTNTAQQSIGLDELALIAALQELKEIDFIRYAFVLNANNEIIQYFDKRGEQDIWQEVEDPINRNLESRDESDQIKITEGKDELGKLFDFSRTVLNTFDGRKIGVVIIGLTSNIIRQEMISLLRIIIIISVGILVLSIIGSIVLASITIRPVQELSHGAEIIGQGDLDYRIDIHSSDELGQLARQFNIMTAQIKEAKEKEIESRIMDEQIEMAKDIQEGLNPMGFYDRNGVQIKGYTRAAKGVGGDYFDYIDIDNNRVGALISDVSGKGVPASLVMVMIRTVFTSYTTRKDIDCAKVVSAINDALSADFAIDKFATLFFMIYDRKNQELSFSNAGHGPLKCYRYDSNKCTSAKLEGVPIGIMDEVDYLQAKVPLKPGDIIVMETDGVTEMRNENKDEYGLERLMKMLMEHHHLGADQIVDTIINDIEEFRGTTPPHDDTTLLVLKRVE